jgi:SAM-dependent methyltransferase
MDFKPEVGQAGKDVVWVPTPQALVEKMLDMARVTPEDFVVDLGSGDGRNIIAAAKRGARALGVEYNPQMVALSTRSAAAEGVSDRASFVQGDMFEADISRATVLALFLLPDNMTRLQPKFLDLAPGARIVGNTFGFQDWTPDAQETIADDCSSWCTALLWIVPAKVEGTWQSTLGELTLTQRYQMLSGSLETDGRSRPIGEGRLRGDRISFTVPGAQYEGRVSGNAIEGTMTSEGRSEVWRATRTAR